MSEDEFGSVGPVVVLTALSLEYEAVRAHLRSPRRLVHENTCFEVGTVSGVACPVILAEAGAGNRPTAYVTEQARVRFTPSAIVFVGVAGSLKADIRVGDVLVGTKIYAYDGAKHVDGAVLARPESWPAPHGLLQTARHALRGDVWRQRIANVRSGGDQHLPEVHFKPIASGEGVLSSLDSGLRELLHRHYNDAGAIEMESAGLAAAGSLGGVQTLTVRGISDCADSGKEAADAAGSQPAAAAHAAAAAIEIIAALPDTVQTRPVAEAVTGAPKAVQVNTAHDQGTVNAVQHGNLTITQTPWSNEPRPGRQ